MSDVPTLTISEVLSGGATVPGLPLTVALAGDVATQIQESYSVTINQRKPSRGNTPSGTPAPPDMNFDSGQFDPLSFAITLFSGCLFGGQELHRGQDISNAAQQLFKLSMPRTLSSSPVFVGPPLVTLTIGRYWSARGLFTKATVVSQGGWDEESQPTLIQVQMEFLRHFGLPHSTGPYQSATPFDLAYATANRFSFY